VSSNFALSRSSAWRHCWNLNAFLSKHSSFKGSGSDDARIKSWSHGRPTRVHAFVFFWFKV
jgi:hypothetical protein